MSVIIDAIPPLAVAAFSAVPAKGGFRRAGHVCQKLTSTIAVSDGSTVSAVDLDTGLGINVPGAEEVEELDVKIVPQ